VQVWEPEAGKPALQLQWSPFGILTCLFYLAATVYYFYVRFTYTMALGITSWCVVMSTWSWSSFKVYGSLRTGPLHAQCGHDTHRPGVVPIVQAFALFGGAAGTAQLSRHAS
jgi:hypothetical protein